MSMYTDQARYAAFTDEHGKFPFVDMTDYEDYGEEEEFKEERLNSSLHSSVHNNVHSHDSI